MKINLNDPDLTAYALGELPEPSQAQWRNAVATSPEAQAFVSEIQEMAAWLEHDFHAELEAAERKPANILPLPAERSFWSDARWMSIGIAAVLAVCTVIAAVLLSNAARPAVRVADHSSPPAQITSSTAPADVQMEIDSTSPAFVAKSEALPEFVEEQPAEAPSALTSASGGSAKLALASRAPTEEAGLARGFDTAQYDQFDENPFLSAATNPLSTFSIDVDTASYANVRRFINSGVRPPRDAVRIEELINYFTYDYPQPEGEEPFSVNLDVASCPWQPEHRLVRIGLKGRDITANTRAASNLVFLLDVSGSMEPANRLPLVRQAMRLLVDQLTENDHVAIVVYAGASGLALPSTRGDQKQKINAALEELKSGGSTNGADGINLAYKIAGENFIPGGVNRVILATDGDFNVGVTSQGDLVRLAEEKAKSGVFLSVLGVGDDNLKDSTMQKLADKGNGNYAYLDSLDEARKVLVQQINGTLVTIAKDVKIQVEFNPARVASYRLIGYEKRMLRKEDFNNDKIDAGEIGAGHAVTALYEVVPVGSGADVTQVDSLKYQTPAAPAANAASPELLTVKLRHKKPAGDTSELTERTLTDRGAEFAQASPDLQFAAAVAEFGMILRASPHRGNGTLGQVLEWAQETKGRDEAGYRAGFIELVRKARDLPL